MQAIGFIAFFVGGVEAAVSAGCRLYLYSALPESVLAYAERHGRFQVITSYQGHAPGHWRDDKVRDSLPVRTTTGPGRMSTIEKLIQRATASTPLALAR